jgi:hypothetical protein
MFDVFGMMLPLHSPAPLPFEASFLVKSSCFRAALAQRSLTSLDCPFLVKTVVTVVKHLCFDAQKSMRCMHN